ncbi:MAG: PD-(D/E)XK nuclease family protein, partial [Actinomycetes bacterium]
PVPRADADVASPEAQPSWVHARLAEAVATVREERFAARPGPACRYCAFAASCPAVGRGRQVVA